MMNPLQQNYDIVIIGGGIAGLTAARELSERGLKLAIIESKERLGGRTWSQQWHHYWVEMGGGWICWTQPHVWAEISRYGLELFERPGWPKAYDTPLIALVDNQPVVNTMTENMEQLFPLVEEFADVVHEVFPRPFEPHRSMAQIQQYDHLSTETRLNEMNVSPLQRVLLSRLLAMQCHNHPKHGGYVEFLRWYALAHTDMETYLSTASRYQLKGGTQSLLNALLGDILADVHLDCQVTSVHQDADQVRITAVGGQTFSAHQAIVALPINVLKHIEFAPSLDESKRALSYEQHSGAGQKLYVRIAGYWPALNCAADADAPITTVLVQEATQSETLLVVFTVNDLLAPITRESIQAGLRLFEPRVEVLDFTFHNWVGDPHALGTWCSYRPGQTSKYLKQVQASQGRLHFAGADIADGWRGFIDGAIESGLRAANEIKSIQ